jgi:peptidoglycan/LPS O-acetylase OafA/YrhL
MSSPNRENAFRTDIEGLRGIAVLAVVFFHAGVQWLSGGFVGVDVFFVISGYLIGAHIYADTSRGRFSIAEFYRKRAKRILPALLVLVAVSCVVAWFVLLPQELVYFARFSMPAVLSYSNIKAAGQISYFDPSSDKNMWLMTWSLGVEEQFYFFFPLLMLALGKRSRKLVLGVLCAVVVLSFVACVHVSYQASQRAFYLLPYRAWELILGALVAVGEPWTRKWFHDRSSWVSQVVSAIGLTLILASSVAYTTHTVFPGVAAAAPVVGAVLLIASTAAWVNTSLLSWEPLRFVGRISYSLYLWHWPMLALVRTVRPDALPVSTACIIVLLAFPVAWLSYRFVEQPFRQSKTPRTKLLLRYALCCCLAILPAIAFKYGNGLPRRFPQLPPSVLELEPKPVACAADHAKSVPNLTNACYSSTDPKPAIAVLGDSHATVLNFLLQEEADRRGYRLDVIEKFGCQPLLGVTNSTGFSRRDLPQTDCLQFNRQALAAVVSNPHIRYVALSAFWSAFAVQGARYMSVGETQLPDLATSDRNFAQGLGQELDALQAAHKQVVLFSDAPVLNFEPELRLEMRIPIRSLLARGHFTSGPLPTTVPLVDAAISQEAEATAILERVAKAHAVPFIDLRSNLCNHTECRYMVGNHLLFKDTDHLAPDGVRLALAGVQLFPPDAAPAPPAALLSH